MLTIILTESSLEIIPHQLYHHPSVHSYSKKFKKKSSNTLLDNSWHFAAMKGLDNEIKRGRPDIVHLTLLSICTSPAFYKNKIKFDDISYLMSVQDVEDLKNICHLFSHELFHIGIFNKKNKSLQLYELENDYKNELASNLEYFKIDIKDIIKNTNN